MLTKAFQTIPLTYHSNSTTLFDNFISSPYCILLDSCSDRRKETGIDVIAAEPYLRFIVHNNNYQLYDANNTLLETGDKALEYLRTLENEEQGSLLGYFGYHCNDAYFQLETDTKQEENQLPDICLGFYSWRIEVDHSQKTAELKYLETQLDETELANLLKKINNPTSQTKSSKRPSPAQNKLALSNFSKDQYLRAFDKVKQYIVEGDCYQVNLAQRFTLPFCGDTWQHYLYLRTISPAPYSCFFSTPFGDVLSFSPESFLEINEFGKIFSKPIKGTRKRHIDMALDQQAALELSQSAKDKAENLMIVDLIRNDLSKSAELNSVVVDKLFEIQSFANVHHMVSQISAQKAKDKSKLDVLLDCFPGGSITGAPKKRAMEIINALEPNKRQVYCGAIGQISFEGKMEFNIAIRTILIRDEQLYCWGGGGLVADSVAEDEYQESILKISNLIPI